MVFAREGKNVWFKIHWPRRKHEKKIVIKCRFIVFKMTRSTEKKKWKKSARGPRNGEKTINIWQFGLLEDFGRVFLNFLAPFHFFFFFLFCWLCMIGFFNTIHLYFITIFFLGFLLCKSILNLTFFPSRKNHGTFRINFCIEVVFFVTSTQNHLRRIHFWKFHFFTTPYWLATNDIHGNFRIELNSGLCLWPIGILHLDALYRALEKWSSKVDERLAFHLGHFKYPTFSSLKTLSTVSVCTWNFRAKYVKAKNRSKTRLQGVNIFILYLLLSIQYWSHCIKMLSRLII